MKPSPHKTAGSGSGRPVAIWMYTGVIMLLIQFILGGIVRLTGSGLSITEWNLFTGILPPLNGHQWQEAFDKYRQTPQFRILNSDFSLSDFKFIYFWEWFHRLWARLVAVVFVIGFLWLLRKKKMQASMIRPLLTLFLLGALQGAVGWIMVASGLTGDAIYVQPTRLAMHFVFALGLTAYAFWFALQLSVPEQMVVRVPKAGRLRNWTIAILAVLFFQLLYGALMAGHKAATVAPTWPDINGDWMPHSAFSGRPLLQDLVGNKITVQWMHRMIAYLIFTMILIWSALAFQLPVGRGLFRRFRLLPILLILAQIILGITALLISPGIIPNKWVGFNWVAQFHQIVGLLTLLAMVGMLYLVRDSRTVRNSVTV